MDPVAAGRTCGDCGLCCKLLGVEAIAKAPLVWCRQFKKGCGCLIYEERPKACADFICYWLHMPTLGDEWRPDRAGFVMHIADQGRRMNIEADPACPNAWRQAPYFEALQDLSRKGAARGLELLVWAGRQCWRFDRGELIDLGLQRPSPKLAKAKPASRLRVTPSTRARAP